MATEMLISASEGYPTDSTMRISVSFSVTYDGIYKTEFELRRGNRYGQIVDTSTGSTFQMNGGDRKSGLIKTFTGLDSGTEYTIVAYLCNADTDTRLDNISDSITFSTSSTSSIFVAKIILDGNGGTYTGYNGVETTCTFEDWSGAVFNSQAELSVNYRDPGFTKTGYTLAGFSTERTALSADYGPSGTIRITVYDTDPDCTRTVKLYAVWKKGRPENWYWTSNVSPRSSLGLTAQEWNGFISRIQAFADYKGITLNASNLASGAAVKGGKMLASQANAVRNLVDQLNPPAAVPLTVKPNESTITAAFVNGLSNSLNSIA